MKDHSKLVSRRHFLKSASAVAGGFTLCLAVPACSEAEQQKPTTENELVPLVTITSTNKVLIPATMSEMGQNVHTSLPQIVADELDANWDMVEITEASADENRYGFQGTWASLSIYTAWDSHRKGGATARDMLLTAAANLWQVDKNACSTSEGVVHHKNSGHSITYGELAEAAALVPIPEKVPLKSPSDFHLIGKPLNRRDNKTKVTGDATFGVDVRADGLKTAAVLKPPVQGAKLKSLVKKDAMSVQGVSHVLEISNGVAVVADTYWAAEKGTQLLEAEWDLGANSNLSSTALMETLRQGLDGTNQPLANKPVIESVESNDSNPLSAQFEFPLLAHATMEPVNFSAHVSDGKCTLWGPTQDRNAVRSYAAEYLSIPEAAVEVNTTFLGGGFGRKADSDFVTDALDVAKQVEFPVKVIWSRENDTKHCIFRPATAHKLSAKVTKSGSIESWQHLVSGHSAEGQEWLPTAGADHIPYKVNGFEAHAHILDTPIPVGTLRGIAHSSTNFANEVFMDELADAAGADPLEFRLSMLEHEPRAQHVLRLLAEQAGWKNHRERGVYQGVALFDKPEEHANFFIGQIAEVSKSADGAITIDKVICVADFGQPVNPDGIIAQVEGGIAYGLSMALYGDLTIENGEVQQSNFHDYQVLRTSEMPTIEVHVVHNTEYPRGCGEHINPATLPAIANAVSKATGTPIRKLPLNLEA